uniref:Putative secreted peptide n=1 Tax=Anopheles braziliensis TaxID=58242 RepID=A0A2M3ZU85_9DIPT
MAKWLKYFSEALAWLSSILKCKAYTYLGVSFVSGDNPLEKHWFSSGFDIIWPGIPSYFCEESKQCT